MKDAEKLATWRDRFVAYHYFFILAATGMRVGEARHLRWNDLRMMAVDDRKQMVAWVQGKTGAREIIFQPGAEDHVRQLYDLRREEGQGEPARDSLVFCHQDGSPVHSFKTAFRSLLKFVELPIVRNGMPRTIYSIRHYYATDRLEKETNPFLLARQMGTSVEMLEKFYGQTSVNPTTARGVSRGSRAEGHTATNQYPFD